MARTTIEMQVRLRAWLPIETAPRDGTPILACHDYTQRTDLAAHPRTVAWIDRVGHGRPCWRNAYGHIERHITHWMPLPTPPVAEEVPRG